MRSVFGDALDTGPVLLKRRRWFPFQPSGVLMAPCGHVHFHPRSPHWCEDFADAHVELQGLFIHEMAHVWQAQRRGRWYLPVCRSFSRRYDYALRPGWTLERTASSSRQRSCGMPSCCRWAWTWPEPRRWLPTGRSCLLRQASPVTDR